MATKDKLVNLEDLKSVYDHGMDLLDEKANQVGEYVDLTAGYADNLVSSSYVSDSEPYLFRKTFAGVREDDEIVGGSIVWNQLENMTSGVSNGITYTKNDDGSITMSGTSTAISSRVLVRPSDLPPVGHKVLILRDNEGTYPTVQTNGENPNISYIHNMVESDYIRLRFVADYTASLTIHVNVIDLTKMFGPTIADYLYSIDSATAGAGVAFFRSLFSKPYYAYNAGEIVSVNTSAHKMVGFNQWDEEWENGAYASGSGTKGTNANKVRNKNPIPILPNTEYYIETPLSGTNVYQYDADMNYIQKTVLEVAQGNTFTSLPNAFYMNFSTFGSDYKVYNNDICINISDPSKNGTYEPYTEVTYPLSPIDLRGIPTIVDGKLKYDGDVYKSDGTVERRYGYRVYQSGDESLANAITDGTHTVYKLTTATTETTDPYTNPQKCYPDGTEEYIDTRDVPIPVGHNTKYMRDLKKLLEGIPDAPSANGTYVLKATVSASGVTYAWVEG